MKTQIALGHPPDRLVLSTTCEMCHTYKGELKKVGEMNSWDTFRDYVDRCVRCMICGREL